MADTVAAEPDLTVGIPTSPASSTKRKRGEDSASPDSRRAKRQVPTATMNAPVDAAAAAVYLEATEAGQIPADASQIHADFTALQQATVEHGDASDPANAVGTAAAALGSMYPTLHVPPTTEETFAAQVGAGADQSTEHSYNTGDMGPNDGLAGDGSPTNMQHNGMLEEEQPRYPGGPAKPAVGSEEWHKLRKDNHKEVERRRRETINEGINELAKIVPGCEKNKGSILARAVQFITQLKENETQNIEKWTLEKLLTEQAITELSSSNDKFKEQQEQLYRELEAWKRVALEAGVAPPPELEGKGEAEAVAS